MLYGANTALTVCLVLAIVSSCAALFIGYKAGLSARQAIECKIWFDDPRPAPTTAWRL